MSDTLSDIVGWLDTHAPGRPTPRKLIQYIRFNGGEPPQWLLDHPEMAKLDDMVTREGRVALIRSAMIGEGRVKA